jgi:hypothetical protein
MANSEPYLVSPILQIFVLKIMFMELFHTLDWLHSKQCIKLNPFF